ncbi:hypothetical protein ACSBR1_022470 [Camellia fascicularis]
MPARSKIRRSSRGDRTAPSSRPNRRTHRLRRIFHIGSGAIESGAYKAAIAVAKAVFDAASQLGLPEMHVLNIGGGFTAGPQFYESATAVKSTIQEYFNEPGENPRCGGARTYYCSTVFQPTCDALDTVLTGYQLPELQVDDWLVFPNINNHRKF